MQQVSFLFIAVLLLVGSLQVISTTRTTTNEVGTSNNKSDQISTTAHRLKQNYYNPNHYGPIVFVPGVGGSQLEARLDKTSRVHRVCRLKTDWFNFWLNIKLLAPFSFDCLIDNMRLIYNKTTKLTHSPQGVEIRARQFGLLDSVDYLDRSAHLPGTAYFHNIINLIETQLGLEPNKDTFGAPYDFRKAPNELDEFFEKFTSLIELSYRNNNYRPVTLICHSMGCLNSLYLLNSKTQQWKDVYIKRLVALAAPWKGSFKAISSLLLGDNLGIPLLDGHKLRILQMTFPSLMYLLPQTEAFDNNIDGERRVLVETMNKKYTFENLDELFKDGEMLSQLEMWYNVRNYTRDFRAPQVELWCLYGTGVETASKVVYEGDLLSSKYKQVMSDGDGTVNIESSLICSSFQQESPGKSVHLQPFEGTSHVGMLRSKQVSDFIVDRILKGT